MFDNYIPYNEQEINDIKLIENVYLQMNNIYKRENETAHFTASSWIVNKDRTKVLMIYHNIYNSWSWTGGHADSCEDLLSVALREAKEETNVTCTPISKNIFSVEILPVSAHYKRDIFVSTHLHINVTYLLEANEEDELKIKEDENSNVSWFDINDIVEKSNEPHMKIVYNKIIEKLKNSNF